jgi:hypothetical protein
MLLGWVGPGNLAWVDTWDMDGEVVLQRDNRDVQEVGYPIVHNRTSAEPDIEVEVVPS